MTALTPLAFTGLLLWPVLMWLNWHRTKPLRVSVPALWPWHIMKGKLATREKKDIFNLRFWTQSACLFLAVFAAAGIVWREGSSDIEKVSITLDDSASMKSKRKDGRTRWELAIDTVKKILAKSPAKNILLALPASDREYRGSARETIDILSTLKSTDIPMTEPIQTSAMDENLHIIITDRHPPKNLDTNIYWLGTGDGNSNMGLVSCGVTVDKGVSRIFIRAYNGNAEERTVPLTIEADKKRIEEEITLKAGTFHDVIIPIRKTSPQRIEMTLEADDALKTDNVFRWKAPKIGIVWKGNISTELDKALRSIPFVEKQTDDSAVSITIYNRTFPEGKPEGPVVFLHPPASSGPLIIEGTLKNPEIDTSSEGHPHFGGQSLSGLSIKKAINAKATAFDEIYLQSSQTPLLGKWEGDGYRAWYAGFALDRENTNWSRSPSFPIFWYNVVEQIRSVIPGMTKRGFIATSADEEYTEQSGWIDIEYNGSHLESAVNLLSSEETQGIGYDNMSGSERVLSALENAADSTVLTPWFLTILGVLVAALWISDFPLKKY